MDFIFILFYYEKKNFKISKQTNFIFPGGFIYTFNDV